MKTIVAIFFVVTLCKGFNGYSQSRISDRQLMNLGIAITDNDMPKSMNYKNAKVACQKLGKQWWLPIFEQFEIIENALVEIGNTTSENKDFWCTKFGSHYPSLWQMHGKL